MKTHKKYLFICYQLLFALLITFCSCNRNISSINSGYVLSKSQLMQPSTSAYKSYIDLPDNWFMYIDSFIVSYRNKINMLGKTNLADNSRWDTIYLSKQNYILYDMRKNKYFEFDTLQKNATLLKQYSTLDSNNAGLGININKTSLVSIQKHLATESVDTIIGGIKHTEYSYTKPFNTESKKDTLKITWRVRYDIKNPLLHLDKVYDSINGCTVVSYEVVPIVGYNNLSEGSFPKYSLEFSNTKISKEHFRVVKKWLRRARKIKS